MRVYESCPVCRRLVSVSSRRDVIRHFDTIGGPCPMSGQAYPLSDFEAAA